MNKIKTILKIAKKILIVVGVIGIAMFSLYAFTVDKVTGEKESEIDQLRSIIEEYKAKDGQLSYENNRGVIRTIEDVCEEEGFDIELAVKIAACESYLNPYFVKINKNGSADRGVFAFNSVYYKSVPNECAFNVECSTRVFIQQAKAGRINDWLCYKRVK